MSNLLVVIGSARPGRVADKVLEHIKADIAARDDVTLTVADLKELNLPYFDNENAPISPEYTISDPLVQAWSDMVQAADSVLFITPEYNHSLTAIQKNALDSLGAEWLEKPVSAVAYGWSGGSLAVLNLREVLENLKADAKHEMAQLGFMKDLNPDGSFLDEVNTMAQIKVAVDELV
ncbi:NAD(P)H-dependent oxidoreductase [Aeromicrobium sp.]|nr:NAD(P)H-dependent oxidoreductase [Candidatus Saccharibacteria bacterium]